MKYEVVLDSDGYVSIIRHTGTVKDFVELDLSLYDLSDDRIHAYKLGRNELIFDAEKYKQITEAKQKIIDFKEIDELKRYLNETDYIIARAFEEALTTLDNPLTFIREFISILVKYHNMYKDVLSQRIKARLRIEELEDKWK